MYLNIVLIITHLLTYPKGLTVEKSLWATCGYAYWRAQWYWFMNHPLWARTNNFCLTSPNVQPPRPHHPEMHISNNYLWAEVWCGQLQAPYTQPGVNWQHCCSQYASVPPQAHAPFLQTPAGHVLIISNWNQSNYRMLNVRLIND